MLTKDAPVKAGAFLSADMCNMLNDESLRPLKPFFEVAWNVFERGENMIDVWFTPFAIAISRQRWRQGIGWVVRLAIFPVAIRFGVEPFYEQVHEHEGPEIDLPYDVIHMPENLK